MSLVELAQFLEETTKKHQITSLIYLERCIDRAKVHGLSHSSREEAAKLVREIQDKIENNHADKAELSHVVETVLSVLNKNK